jgi:peptidoglycan/xylan/chitin deacetylase (PgdA/CDA1 family)
MEKVIEEQTGSRTRLLRFPGGSSNTVSDFNPGIMTQLVKETEEKGYFYFDWNVSSGDAVTSLTADEVVKNVKEGVALCNTSVILCHDTKEFTVNNIEYVIAWALENGYTFLPLNETSTTAHHAVLN